MKPDRWNMGMRAREWVMLLLALLVTALVANGALPRRRRRSRSDRPRTR